MAYPRDRDPLWGRRAPELAARPRTYRLHHHPSLLIWASRRLGVSTGTVLRMIGNVGLDALISAIPVAGSVGDVFFRANRRNMALLRQHIARDTQ
ncbi:DUF4112 domain-containing protein [Roseicella frigidaeris]